MNQTTAHRNQTAAPASRGAWRRWSGRGKDIEIYSQINSPDFETETNEEQTVVMTGEKHSRIPDGGEPVKVCARGLAMEEKTHLTVAPGIYLLTSGFHYQQM